MRSYGSFELAQEGIRDIVRWHLSLCGGPECPAVGLRKLAKTLHIRLVSEPFPEDREFTGAAFMSDDGFQLIVVNSLLKPARWRFTVAHEIGHIIMEHRPPRNDAHEKLANYYAAELLMPADQVMREVQRWGTDNLEFIAGLHGVSITAMRLRIQELACEIVNLRVI